MIATSPNLISGNINASPHARFHAQWKSHQTLQEAMWVCLHHPTFPVLSICGHYSLFLTLMCNTFSGCVMHIVGFTGRVTNTGSVNYLVGQRLLGSLLAVRIVWQHDLHLDS